ncbi:MAG: DegT/DnrJ/EryC1/StrS aminotransferase family protein [Candidatus Magasanikbacteria bacterium]
MNKRKILFTGFAPNLTLKDIKIASGFLFNPLKWNIWRYGVFEEKVTKKLKNYLGVEYCYTFDSGRSALYYALKSLGVKEGDIVAVQAYTCVVVVNAIKQVGATPLYIDIGPDLNMDPSDLKSKLTNNTSCVIIQHTFGQPAKLEELLSVVKDSGIKTIEDCAHAFGVTHKGALLGRFGDIGMYSFGADKSLSSARGGALSTKSQELAKVIENELSSLKKPSLLSVFQHLAHFPLFYIGKKFYHLGVGKWLLWIFKKLNILNTIVHRKEKNGLPLHIYPSSLPNALCAILINQIDGVDEVNKHRSDMKEVYDKELGDIQKQKVAIGTPTLRYTLFVDNPKELLQKAKEMGVILGSWYDTVLAPCDIDMNATVYTAGSCPNAEKYSKQSINLPTNRYIEVKDAKYIARIVNDYVR